MTATVAILGATGSIGASALGVIARHRDRYRVAGVSANRNAAAMRELCAAFAPDLAVMADDGAAKKLADQLPAGANTRVAGGDDGLMELATAADIVVCGIVGAAGLRSTLAAVRGGKKVLIANKEPLVMVGELIMREARASGATVIPVDSEHNAIFQCLAAAAGGGEGGSTAAGARPDGLAGLILTGSGGPFRRLPAAEFARVTPAQARAHPNWSMGAKVSVDSATMMNKGLELIEARALFSLAADAIDIVVHPQSVVHSMVEFVDGSILAQLGSPDMRVAIAHALGWPRRIASGARRLNLTEVARLDFEAPDEARFACLRLAREAARAGGGMPAVMNAANEVAVAAFLNGELRFDRIAEVVEQTMARFDSGGNGAGDRECSLENALAADLEARRLSRELLAKTGTVAVAAGAAAEASAAKTQTAAPS